jgi:hypothetical protein
VATLDKPEARAHRGEFDFSRSAWPRHSEKSHVSDIELRRVRADTLRRSGASWEVLNTLKDEDILLNDLHQGFDQ